MNAGSLTNNSSHKGEVKGGREQAQTNIFMRQNTKGLSNIVSTVLIVLLALAAVAIVWSFIRPAIESSGSSVRLTQQCLEVEVEPVSCVNTTANLAQITLKVSRGEPAEIIGLLDLNDSTRITNQTTTPGLLGTKVVTFSITGKQAVTAQAAAIVADKDDPLQTQTCGESTKTIPCVSAP